MFHFILRPSEAILAIRENLVLPSDNCSATSIAYLTIPIAKSRWRGPRTQHASTRNPDFIRLLERRYSTLKSSARLFPGSATSYRKTWDSLVKAFGIPPHMFTPASLRGGGCCHAFHADPSIENIMWRMRVTSIVTLKHYLQEVVSISTLNKLSTDSRAHIQAAVKAYDFTTIDLQARASH